MYASVETYLCFYLYIVDENLLKKVQATTMFILTTIDALQMKCAMNIS